MLKLILYDATAELSFTPHCPCSVLGKEGQWCTERGGISNPPPPQNSEGPPQLFQFNPMFGKKAVKF